MFCRVDTSGSDAAKWNRSKVEVELALVDREHPNEAPKLIREMEGYQLWDATSWQEALRRDFKPKNSLLLMQEWAKR